LAAIAANDDDDEDGNEGSGGDADRGPYEYELWLSADLYTDKHTQWYYFMVSNTRPGVTYRFNIVNFIKVCLRNLSRVVHINAHLFREGAWVQEPLNLKLW